MSIPRTTHTWLAPLYDALEGRGTRQPQIGSATGTVGLYGATGIARLATGTAGITGLTGAGGMTAFSMVWINGGSGAFYTLTDVVAALKNVGILKP
jgi:hypothetical protein